mgnify:CR=1 FL=1
MVEFLPESQPGFHVLLQFLRVTTWGTLRLFSPVIGNHPLLTLDVLFMFKENKQAKPLKKIVTYYTRRKKKVLLTPMEDPSTWKQSYLYCKAGWLEGDNCRGQQTKWKIFLSMKIQWWNAHFFCTEHMSSCTEQEHRSVSPIRGRNFLSKQSFCWCQIEDGYT